MIEAGDLVRFTSGYRRVIGGNYKKTKKGFLKRVTDRAVFKPMLVLVVGQDNYNWRSKHHSRQITVKTADGKIKEYNSHWLRVAKKGTHTKVTNAKLMLKIVNAAVKARPLPHIPYINQINPMPGTVALLFAHHPGYKHNPIYKP